MNRLFVRIALAFIAVYYRLSLLLTRVRYPVANHASYEAVADALSWGRAYEADPLRGVADYIRHPSRVQRRLDAAASPGDCDDHASYWCAAVERAGLCEPGTARVGVARYRDAKGKRAGHAIALWRDAETGRDLWADYRLPTPHEGDWAAQVCARRGAKLRWSGEVLRGWFA